MTKPGGRSSLGGPASSCFYHQGDLQSVRKERQDGLKVRKSVDVLDYRCKNGPMCSL